MPLTIASRSSDSEPRSGFKTRLGRRRVRQNAGFHDIRPHSGECGYGFETVLLWQVASEFVNGLRRWESKQVLTPEKVNDFVGWMIEMFPIVTPQHMTVLTALDLSRR